MPTAIDIFLNRLASPSAVSVDPAAVAAGPRRIPITSGARPAAFSSRHNARAIRDVTTYSILCRVGRIEAWVDVWIERDDAHCDLESTITDILAGQVENVRRIEARNTVEGWAIDASEDIAIEIANRIGRRGDGAAVERSLLDFIETHAGADYARGLRVREDAFAGE